MKKMTVEQLFAAPKAVRRFEARAVRAKLTMVAARERATEMAMVREKEAQPSSERPNKSQRRRLARM